MSSSADLPVRIALIGNPNSGKTTLFNLLTGSRQKVANYPGVTVESVEGQLNLGSERVTVVDVPGLYSTEPVSEDEQVAMEVISGRHQPVHLSVCVVDGSNLGRSLFLFTQLAELGQPMIVVVSKVDRLQASGRRLDGDRLAGLLGCPVVPVDAFRGAGIDALKAAIATALETRPVPSPKTPKADQAALIELAQRLARVGNDIGVRGLQSALDDPDQKFIRFTADFPELKGPFEAALAEHQASRMQFSDSQSRYLWTDGVQKSVVSRVREAAKSLTLTDRIDRILIHRVFGLVIFAGVMFLVFQSIYTLSAPLQNLIEAGFEAVKGIAGPPLAGIPVLQSLIVDGIIGGVSGIVVFLPQILILFAFIALLESSGYLARAAFLMDRLLGWCGLSGRAFIPLLSSFACAIPGVMAARVMPDAKSRLATILVAPLMSCSARLPVYMLLISAFIEPQFGALWAGFTLFAMHLLGLVVAIPVVFILNKGLLKGKRLPFVLELPPYQAPRLRDIVVVMVTRAKVFLTTAGTTILLMSVLIWSAAYFPRLSREETASIRAQTPPEQVEQVLAARQLEQSALGRFGRIVEPVFAPVGFDWRISTAILSAFPARETVVPSLGILFSLGAETDESSSDLKSALQSATWPDGRKLVTPWTAIGLMVFFALCAQCLSTLAVVRRETNSVKWAVFMFTYMTALAYLGALLVQWIGSRFA